MVIIAEPVLSFLVFVVTHSTRLATCSTLLPISSARSFTRSTPLSIRSTRLSIRLSIRSTRLFTCSICLPSRSARNTICWSFYN